MFPSITPNNETLDGFTKFEFKKESSSSENSEYKSSIGLIRLAISSSSLAILAWILLLSDLEKEIGYRPTKSNL